MTWIVLFWYYFGTMSKNITKMQVPIDKDVLTALKKRAHDLGFDSAQAYVRFWAKVEADYSDDGPDPRITVLSRAAEVRYAKMIEEMEAERKAGKAKIFTTADEALDYLHNLK